MTAVLVAIAIPVFTTQLEKSREAVDAANIRAEYAQCMTEIVSDGKLTGTHQVTLKQEKTGWDKKFDFPSNLKEGTTDPAKNGVVTFTYTDSATPGEAGTLSVDIKLK